MSAVPRSGSAPGDVRREVQSALVDAQGVAEPALGPPDVAEGDAAAEDVGNEPGLLEPGDGLGVGGVRASRSPVGP